MSLVAVLAPEQQMLSPCILPSRELRWLDVCQTLTLWTICVQLVYLSVAPSDPLLSRWQLSNSWPNPLNTHRPRCTLLHLSEQPGLKWHVPWRPSARVPS